MARSPKDDIFGVSHQGLKLPSLGQHIPKEGHSSWQSVVNFSFLVSNLSFCALVLNSWKWSRISVKGVGILDFCPIPSVSGVRHKTNSPKANKADFPTGHQRKSWFFLATKGKTETKKTACCQSADATHLMYSEKQKDTTNTVQKGPCCSQPPGLNPELRISLWAFWPL